MYGAADSCLKDHNALSSDDTTMTEVTDKEQVPPTKGAAGLDNGVQIEARDRQIAAELTRLVYVQMPVAFAITLLNATLLVFVLRRVVDFLPLLSWWTTMGSIALLRLGVMYRYRRAVSSSTTAHRWQTLFILGAIVAGCGWGATSLFLFPAESLPHQLFLIFILGGMAIGAVTSMAAIKSAYVGFVLPTTVPLILRFFFEGGELFVVMGVLSTIFVTGILLMAAQFHAAIHESLAFRFERRDLLQSQEVLQQSNEELDRRVQARTAELMTANAALQAEIAEHERTETELRESEFRSRAMLQAIPDMMFRANRAGVFVDYKPREMFRTVAPAEFFIGKHLADIVPADTAEAGLKTIATVLQTGQMHVLEYALVVEGVSRDYEARVAPSGPDEVVAIVRDITQRKEVDRLKDEFISVVNHELRTPLASVRGFTELMLSRNFSPEGQRELLSIIQRETTRLTDLINDLLDLRRIESGQQSYHFTDVDLAAVLRASVALFSNTTGTHTFQVQIPDQVPQVRADADRLHQVLINLLSNAVKFSPQGGTITTGIRTAGEEIVVWVADQGMGIAPEELPKVFDRFFRTDNRDVRKIGGTGLGLTLVKEIIAAHGGKIWVESHPGQGSTFFFMLPYVNTVSDMRTSTT
jgi:signal transduction histidine kinase